MSTAKELRARVREAERAKAKMREDAVVAVVTAGEAIAAEQVAVEERKRKLRQQLERDLAAEDAKVTAREIAAGEAVSAALGGQLGDLGVPWREGELHELTGFGIADLRRWARLAREHATKEGGGEPLGGAVPADADRRAAVPPQRVREADAADDAAAETAGLVPVTAVPDVEAVEADARWTGPSVATSTGSGVAEQDRL